MNFTNKNHIGFWIDNTDPQKNKNTAKFRFSIINDDIVSKIVKIKRGKNMIHQWVNINIHKFKRDKVSAVRIYSDTGVADSYVSKDEVIHFKEYEIRDIIAW